MSNSNEKSFHISVGDDPDHEDFTAEIYFEDSFVALITQEQGFDRALIEIQPPPTAEPWTFPLSDFLEVVERAKQRLWELRKTQ